jgi:hypothetical protein
VNKENKPSYISGSYDSVYSPTSRAPLSPNHEARTPPSVTSASLTSTKGDFEAYLNNWRKTAAGG